MHFNNFSAVCNKYTHKYANLIAKRSATENNYRLIKYCNKLIVRDKLSNCWRWQLQSHSHHHTEAMNLIFMLMYFHLLISLI